MRMNPQIKISEIRVSMHHICNTVYDNILIKSQNVFMIINFVSLERIYVITAWRTTSHVKYDKLGQDIDFWTITFLMNESTRQREDWVTRMYQNLIFFWSGIWRNFKKLSYNNSFRRSRGNLWLNIVINLSFLTLITYKWQIAMIKWWYCIKNIDNTNHHINL